MPNRDEPYLYDVFLCYNSADRESVESFARRLHGDGIRLFYDQWNLIPGRPWQEELEAALAGSRTCAVFVGPGKLGPWQTEEMRVALDQRVHDEPRAVMSVLLPGSAFEGLPAFLNNLTGIDFSSGLDNPTAYHRLLAGIRGQAPGPPGLSQSPA